MTINKFRLHVAFYSNLKISIISINAVKITTPPLDQMFFAFAVDVIEH